MALGLWLPFEYYYYYYSRGLSLLEQQGAEGDVEDDSLDLAGYWFQLQLDVMVEWHGGGIADHVDGR